MRNISVTIPDEVGAQQCGSLVMLQAVDPTSAVFFRVLAVKLWRYA
jgi:hypothetical protein